MGNIARITNNGKLLIKGEIIEGGGTRFTEEGNIHINELIEGNVNYMKIGNSNMYVNELIENKDFVPPYLAQDSDFVNVEGYWIYRGAELEIEIPTHIEGELVTSTSGMFVGVFEATPVTKVVLNHSNVTNMNSMFALSSATTLDLSSFNTSNVTNMGGMFSSSSATTLDLSNFDTTNVTDMSYMFAASSATTLDLSSFNTSNVTNMGYMFANSSATTLDLSSFDTSNVTYMGSMFKESTATTGYARTQADADKFNASKDKPAGLNFVVK